MKASREEGKVYSEPRPRVAPQFMELFMDAWRRGARYAEESIMLYEYHAVIQRDWQEWEDELLWS